MCVSYKLWSWQARYRRYSPLKTQLPWFYLKGHPRSKVIKSTERPYTTYYMCFIETCIITCTIQKIQPIKNSITLILPLQVIQGQRSWGQLRDHIYDLLYVFHINFGYNMHHFWNISANRSQRPKFDLSDLQNDL